MPLEVNQEDLARFIDAYDAAVQASSLLLVDAIADGAVKQIASFDSDLEHHFRLADAWTYDAKLTDDGAEALVWSRAEDDTFYNRTTNAQGERVKSTDYPLAGYRLLEILEGGAMAHPIEAGTKTGAKALTIPVLQATAANGLQQTGTELRTAVDHPGVTGNENVKTTGQLIVDDIASIEEAMNIIVNREFWSRV